VPRNRTSPVPKGAQLVTHPKHTLPHPTIGHVTSTCYSPTLAQPIALALLERGRERYGETVYAMSPLTNTIVEVDVVHSVFYDPKGERLRG
jgi:sarcosine oxidase subunit alpha